MVGGMDWSVLVMGGLLLLFGGGRLWWERAASRNGVRPGAAVRFPATWLPLLLGLCMVIAKAPHLLGAPHAVVRIADTVNVVLAVGLAVGAFLQAKRAFTASREIDRG